MARIRIGTRGSQLALWQARYIADRLRQAGDEPELEVIKTTGDRITGVALAQVGTKGMFTKEIEEALADGRVDVAVHSLKDLPTELPPEFALAAVPERAEADDAFLALAYDSLEALPNGARVGTSSLRRQAQLLYLRPDLRVCSLRGNVDTRLRKLEAGDYDAIVLAAAGLQRLGKVAHIRQILAPERLCPAAGQGALGLEIRRDDAATRAHLAFLDHAPSRRATQCERALLNQLGGGCQVPIGAHAVCLGTTLRLSAICARPDGSTLLREQATGTDPLELGQRVGVSLLARGGQKILDEIEPAARAAEPAGSGLES